MRREDQERGLVEVQHRIVAQYLAAAEAGGVPLEEILALSLYHEQKRLKDEPDSKTRQEDTAFWNDIHRRINHASPRELKEMLGQVVEHYAREIVGNFNDRVYQFTTRVLPTSLSLLFNAVSPKRLLRNFPQLPRFDETIIVQGEQELLRRLHELGTVILVPTHVSNIDSIAMGYSIYQVGLPPFIYGAGLNLFTNPLLSFFMHNLGAYTVDRKKKDPLYKDVLKEYATITLEYGYDNLFFPGGTRSRSGALEKHLKLGLLGTGVTAYIHNLKRKAPKPKIFIVPATISCQLVLEAETLIDDFLKEVGKARYIITDDEFSQPRRVFDFISQLLSLDSKIHITISRGYDPFGNPVDENGESLDPCGRRVDPSRYVLVDDEPAHLPQRDAEYTREVAERIVEAYAVDNVVQTTHVTARAMFHLLRARNRQVDLLRLIRVGGREEEIELTAVYEEAERILKELRLLASRGKVRLGPLVDHGPVEEVIAAGLMHFAIYHKTPAVQRRGDRLKATDRSLLFYYQNRLEGYGLESALKLGPALSPDHRMLGGRS